MEQLLLDADTIIQQVYSSDSNKLHGFWADLFKESPNSNTPKPLDNKRLLPSHRLLERYVQNENPNRVILNLFPAVEGFSVQFKHDDKSGPETIRLGYENDSLLNAIDREEIPLVLLDLLDGSSVNFFHAGCLIVEIIDYRRSANQSTPIRSYSLLRPTNASIISDVNSIATASGAFNAVHFSARDKLHLESHLVLAASDPVCLDPRPLVGAVANKLHRDRTSERLLCESVLRNAERYSEKARRARERNLFELPAPRGLGILDIIERFPRQPTVIPRPEPPSDPDAIVLTPPSSCDVEKYAKDVQKPESLDRSGRRIIIKPVERLLLETERPSGGTYKTLITVSQRVADGIFFGELAVQLPVDELSSSNDLTLPSPGSNSDSLSLSASRGFDISTATDRSHFHRQSCTFTFRTRREVDRYLYQFREIFTEEGRRNVKITHQFAGHTPTTFYSNTTPQTSLAMHDGHTGASAMGDSAVEGQPLFSLSGSDIKPRAANAKLSLSGTRRASLQNVTPEEEARLLSMVGPIQRGSVAQHSKVNHPPRPSSLTSPSARQLSATFGTPSHRQIKRSTSKPSSRSSSPSVPALLQIHTMYPGSVQSHQNIQGRQQISPSATQVYQLQSPRSAVSPKTHVYTLAPNAQISPGIVHAQHHPGQAPSPPIVYRLASSPYSSQADASIVYARGGGSPSIRTASNPRHMMRGSGGTSGNLRATFDGQHVYGGGAAKWVAHTNQGMQAHYVPIGATAVRPRPAIGQPRIIASGQPQKTLVVGVKRPPSADGTQTFDGAKRGRRLSTEYQSQQRGSHQPQILSIQANQIRTGSAPPAQQAGDNRAITYMSYRQPYNQQQYQARARTPVSVNSSASILSQDRDGNIILTPIVQPHR